MDITFCRDEKSPRSNSLRKKYKHNLWQESVTGSSICDLFYLQRWGKWQRPSNERKRNALWRQQPSLHVRCFHRISAKINQDLFKERLSNNHVPCTENIPYLNSINRQHRRYIPNRRWTDFQVFQNKIAFECSNCRCVLCKTKWNSACRIENICVHFVIEVFFYNVAMQWTSMCFFCKVFRFVESATFSTVSIETCYICT